jgi:hypothetical protein
VNKCICVLGTIRTIKSYRRLKSIRRFFVQVEWRCVCVLYELVCIQDDLFLSDNCLLRPNVFLFVVFNLAHSTNCQCAWWTDRLRLFIRKIQDPEYCRLIALFKGTVFTELFSVTVTHPRCTTYDLICIIAWIFHWHNPSDRAMALGSTEPLTEMSTRSISWR